MTFKPKLAPNPPKPRQITTYMGRDMYFKPKKPVNVLAGIHRRAG